MATDETLSEQLAAALYNKVNIPAYESSSTSYKNSHRKAVLGDSDLLAVSELLLLQSRARHAARNSPVAHAAEDVYVQKLGEIQVEWQNEDGTIHELMQDLWKEWRDNPNFDGIGCFGVTQTTWNHERFQTGEAICRMLIDINSPNRVKLKLQNIGSEYLDIGYRGYEKGELNQPPFSTKYGMTFKNGIPEIYHFLQENYYGIQTIADYNQNWTRIPVPAKDIIHIFERKRANQFRGIPLVAPILLSLYEIEDLCGATVDKQKAAAIVAWVVEQGQYFDQATLGQYRERGNASSVDKEKKEFTIANGGGTFYLNAGERLSLQQSSDIGTNLVLLIKHELDKISAALGIPAFMLTGDTSNLNFSNLNAMLIQLRNKLEFVHYYITIPMGLSKLVARFKEIAALRYAVSTAKATFKLPKQLEVDRLKAAQAYLLELQMGATTLERIQDEYDVTMQEVLQSRKQMTENGLQDIFAMKSSATQTTNQDKNVQPDSQTTGF